MEDDTIGMVASGCVMGALLLTFVGFVTYSCVTRKSKHRRRRTRRYGPSSFILPFKSSASQVSYGSSRMFMLENEKRKGSNHSRKMNGAVGNRTPYPIQSSDLDPGYHIRMAQWARRSYGEMSDEFDFEEESNAGGKASSTRRKSGDDTNNPIARTSVLDRTSANNAEREYVIIDYVDGNNVPDKETDLTDMYNEILRESKAWEDQEENDIVVQTVEVTEVQTVEVTDVQTVTEVDSDRQRKASDPALATELKPDS